LKERKRRLYEMDLRQTGCGEVDWIQLAQELLLIQKVNKGDVKWGLFYISFINKVLGLPAVIIRRMC
jgi:hypothetical protein